MEGFIFLIGGALFNFVYKIVRFDSGVWSKISARERSRKLYKLASLIQENASEFAHLEALDNGKPLSMAEGDINAVVEHFVYYAGWADKIHGKVSIDYLSCLVSK